jgi:hypothetical protein
MPLYLIERTFAERFEAAREELREKVGDILKANDTAGVDWLFSFLSADKRKTYCLYEATSPEAIREAASLAEIPSDSIIEVDKIAPESWGFPASSNALAGDSD